MIPSSHNEVNRFQRAFAALPQEARDLVDADTLDSILGAAARIADDVLAPLDEGADRQGCRVENGRVKTPAGYREAFAAVTEGGWIGLDQPEDYGGSALPILLRAITTALFDRAGLAFGMSTGATISGAALLAEHAPADVAQDWIPALIAGERTTTICISESDAGSDVGRMGTRAERDGDEWHIHGNKQWISFGDHDLTDRIGHCLLARTGDAPGGFGLSLFLVPSTFEDGSRNAISLIRIEEKLGLHGSPTCALSFDGARATLLGTPARGLSQLFTMISVMRLQVACQGLACAARATEISEDYAAERLQGGDPKAPPVAISSHPDVQRQLRWMRGQTEALRAVVMQLASSMDAGKTDPHAAALAQLLLPLAKSHGSEIGFDVTNAGIQVLGGAGYTRDWPLEQALRDIRVAAIYEGTTGMQAIDFVERRLIREPQGFDAFVVVASGPLVDRFVALVAELRAAAPSNRLAAADAVLRAGWLAVVDWLGPRLPEDAGAVTEDMADLFTLHEARARRALK